MNNPILIGQCEEIDLIRPDVRKMIDNEGVYICGDTKFPDIVNVPVVSMGGRLYTLKVDEEIAPERFLDTVIIKGPYRVDTGEQKEVA